MCSEFYGPITNMDLCPGRFDLILESQFYKNGSYLFICRSLNDSFSQICYSKYEQFYSIEYLALSILHAVFIFFPFFLLFPSVNRYFHQREHVKIQKEREHVDEVDRSFNYEYFLFFCAECLAGIRGKKNRNNNPEPYGTFGQANNEDGSL